MELRVRTPLEIPFALITATNFFVIFFPCFFNKKFQEEKLKQKAH
jgi:ABC-type multidrug transport system permease subunit